MACLARYLHVHRPWLLLLLLLLLRARWCTRAQGDFYEALCRDVDPVKKELVCCFPEDAGLDKACFKLSYDVLLVSVSRPLSLCRYVQVAHEYTRMGWVCGRIGHQGRTPRRRVAAVLATDAAAERLGRAMRGAGAVERRGATSHGRCSMQQRPG